MKFLPTPAQCNGRNPFSRLSMMATLIAGLVFSGFLSLGAAEQSIEVRPVSHTHSLPRSTSDLFSKRGVLPGVQRPVASHTVRFAQLTANIGDRVGQEVRVELNLSTTITQSGQVAHQSQHVIQRRQDRGIEVLEVAEGRAGRVHVTYLTSRQVRREARVEQEQAEGQAIPQPIEGKSYYVTRQGQQLLITDQDDNIPPLEQYQLVLENMQTLGQPNPLARFLLGRTFITGERIALPQSLAEQLLGLGEPFGKVQSFELELTGSDRIDGQQCALFTATIAAVALEQGEIGLNITGRLAIQTATCRTVAAELTGPVQMASEERTGRGSFQYRATGDMRLSIHSTYATVGR
jgi:hypothetical protein